MPNNNEAPTDIQIEKNTMGDKRDILSNSLREVTEGYPYLLDFDESNVYYEVYTDSGYKVFRDAYTFNGTSAKLVGEPTKVVRLTEYKEVEEEVYEEFLSKALGYLTKHFGGTKDNSKAVIKQFDEEEMIAIEKLYIHPEDTDGVGDTISLEDTVGMVFSLNKAIKDGTLQHGLFHKHKTDAFTVVKAWVAEVDCTIGETDIREGQPLIKVQFNNKDAWELRKSGDLAGISIGARATEIEELDE
jgi:hypothetical protein